MIEGNKINVYVFKSVFCRKLKNIMKFKNDTTIRDNSLKLVLSEYTHW